MPDRTRPHIVPPTTDTPPGALPVIREGTVVRFSIGVLITAITAVVAFALWLAAMSSDVRWLKDAVGDMRLDLRELKERKP